MALAFNEENERRLAQLLSRYPTRQAALIPALYLAQEQWGYLSDEVMAYVAERLDLPKAYVINTATFYTLLRKRPVGRYLIQVCRNVSCYLRGSDDVLAALQEHLGIRPGETTPDGLFTLEEVECLASCGTAPALQVNLRYHENMTPQSAIELVERLRAQARAATNDAGGAQGSQS